MSGWGRFQSQFYETAFERRQRFQRQKDALRAQGKCWQCARPINECKCHNLGDVKEGEKNEL